MTDRRVSAPHLVRLLGPVDPNIPAYQWISDSIRLLIADGRLLHDTRLPSERDLVTALALSRTTVTHAYAILRDKGYAQSRQGSGTVVRVPGGPASGGGEPLPLASLDDGSGDVIDLTHASPMAVPGLSVAYAEAVDRLPAFVGGGGYFHLGVPQLREQIASGYRARGVPTDAEQIIVTVGALGGLAAVFRALVRPGDRVIAQSPGYPNSLGALSHSGARVVPVTDDGAGIEQLLDTIHRSGARAMLAMPDFHNPTGVVWSEDERARVAAAWRERGVIGIVDDTTARVWLDAEPQVRPMAAHSADCVSVGSASKSHWGGLRIGWIRAPHNVIGAIARARLSLDLGAPILEQLVVAQLLRESDGLADSVRRQLIASREALLELATACPGWRTRVPEGGLSLWWQLPQPKSSALVTAARRHGILLAPGSAFAVTGHGLERWVRTPYGLDDVTLRRAVPIIAQAWAEAKTGR
ncbi:GntR family transcriptional regulator [Rudaeicoccus suwonensis]|uniref:GntR family transcriptional regulator n=1 Tax=Rudaeicoccus suwonensis TaxID=657409 RepID=A0A561EBE4_9MICO|nr:GntR family transcriptional regulator [Rudaeicoccus suwonensis]